MIYSKKIIKYIKFYEERAGCLQPLEKDLAFKKKRRKKSDIMLVAEIIERQPKHSKSKFVLVITCF